MPCATTAYACRDSRDSRDSRDNSNNRHITDNEEKTEYQYLTKENIKFNIKLI
jgi:hypothetical protein